MYAYRPVSHYSSATVDESLSSLLLLTGNVCERLLDIGAGEAQRTRHIECKKLRLLNDMLVEKDDSGTNPSRLYYDAVHLLDILRPGTFDLITCLDTIEHFKKEDGYRVIETVNMLACGRIVFFTPLGPMDVRDQGRKYYDHLSGWYPEDFTAIGYSCLVFPHFHPTLNFGAFYAVRDVRSTVNNKTPYPNILAHMDNYWVTPSGGGV